MANSSKYPNGFSKWDSNRYPQTNNDFAGNGPVTQQVSEYNGPASMESVLCSDITIAPDNNSFRIIKGTKEIFAEKQKITVLQFSGNIMFLNTKNNIPYSVAFKNSSEVACAENRLYCMMNDLTDPGY